MVALAMNKIFSGDCWRFSRVLPGQGPSLPEVGGVLNEKLFTRSATTYVRRGRCVLLRELRKLSDAEY